MDGGVYFGDWEIKSWREVGRRTNRRKSSSVGVQNLRAVPTLAHADSHFGSQVTPKHQLAYLSSIILAQGTYSTLLLAFLLLPSSCSLSRFRPHGCAR
jgi:hypothetical protein